MLELYSQTFNFSSGYSLGLRRKVRKELTVNNVIHEKFYNAVPKMMFDPPDYPYKELSETYDNLLLNNNTSCNLSDETLVDVSASITEENQILFHSNDSGRYFNIENAFLQDSKNAEQNKELHAVQSENLLSYEPTLLDENTVTQFLLPLQECPESIKEAENNGPDSLALHSCVICHEIFTNEADLLDHMISMHASTNYIAQSQNNLLPFDDQAGSLPAGETNNNEVDLETEWLVCCACKRILSTALEVETTEQVCCIDINGKCTNLTRKLHAMYVCDFCRGLFADNEALNKHHLTCFIEEQKNCYIDQRNDTSNHSDLNEGAVSIEICYSCDTCSKQYSSTDELKAHLIECKKHEAPRSSPFERTNSSSGSNKMWNCGSCNQLFSTARELYRHKRGEDRPEGAPLTAYVCEECNKVLGSMCALHTHKKMHKITNPGYACNVCDRRFNQSGHLSIHMRMHTGERPYPCDLCSKAFKVKVERDDHRRTHTGERPFACTVCPKTFTAAARLREHARIHTDQRPYPCDICGAAFRRPYARTTHMLIHSGEKPHECDVCGTAFRRSGDMWKHKRTIHGIQAVYVEAAD